MNLTEEQSKAVAEHPEGVRLIDPQTNRAYVLVSFEAFERVRELLADDPKDAYAAVDRAFAEGWNDPQMDDYDRYEELKP